MPLLVNFPSTSEQLSRFTSTRKSSKRFDRLNKILLALASLPLEADTQLSAREDAGLVFGLELPGIMIGGRPVKRFINVERVSGVRARNASIGKFRKRGENSGARRKGERGRAIEILIAEVIVDVIIAPRRKR